MTTSDAPIHLDVPPPALLFDLDGTLVDSVYQHVIAWQEALSECGIALLHAAYYLLSHLEEVGVRPAR